MKNIKAGGNFVTAKLSNDFATLGFNSSNTLRIYLAENGTYKSWEPGRDINSLASIEASKGYMIIAKIDFDNPYFTPPLLRFPDVITYTKTSNSITATFANIPGAMSYAMHVQSSNGGGSKNAAGGAGTSSVSIIFDSLNPDTAYTCWLSVFAEGNFEFIQEDTDKQVITTDV